MSTEGGELPSGARPARGRRGLRWVIALGALLVTLLVGEVVTRVWFPSWFDAEMIAAEQAGQKFWVHRALSDDSRLYYELRPDLQMSFGGVPVHTSSDGRRVPDTPVTDADRPAGEPVRLALIGDSSSFGWKVTFAEHYAERVRAQLEQAWQRPVDLINFAVPGYNAEQEARQLETDVLPWKPDLILWHYDHNDADPILAFNEPLVLPPAWGDNALGSALVKALRRRQELRRLAGRVLQTEEHPRLGGYIREGALYDRHLDALRRASGLAADAGIPALLIVFDADVRPPGEHDGHFGVLHEGLAEVLGTLHFDVLDLYPLYRAELAARGWTDLSGWWLSTGDLHPNPDGHAFIAEQVTRKVLATPELSPR